MDAKDTRKWNEFIKIMNAESDDSNFKIDFKNITKKFGREFIMYCKAAWEANEGVMIEEEFCKINGNMPIGFFNKQIK